MKGMRMAYDDAFSMVQSLSVAFQPHDMRGLARKFLANQAPVRIRGSLN